MIPIKEGDVTRLVPESARVVDCIKPGQMLVYRRIPIARRRKTDKPATLEDIRNGQRAANYAERLNGIKPASNIQLWSV